MKYRISLINICISILIMVFSGCGRGAQHIPDLTLDVTNALFDEGYPASIMPTGRVVLAEVFTYDE
jgi:hypothetical protein